MKSGYAVAIKTNTYYLNQTQINLVASSAAAFADRLKELMRENKNKISLFSKIFAPMYSMADPIRYLGKITVDHIYSKFILV